MAVDPAFTRNTAQEAYAISRLGMTQAQIDARGGINASGYYGDSWSSAKNLSDAEYAAAAAKGGGAAVNAATAAKVAASTPAPAQSAAAPAGAAIPISQGGVNQSAKDVVNSFLKDAGLGALSDSAWSQWTSGATAAQIIDYVRSTPEYATRFPAMGNLNKAGRNISEAQYIAKEQADLDMMKQFGVTSPTYTSRAYLGSLMTNNVNLTDLQARLIAAQDSVLSKDPAILKYAQDTFGLTQGDLMAWALDPTAALPDIQQKAKAFQIGGAALQAGYSDTAAAQLSKEEANALAARGITAAQAQQGFTNLAQMNQYSQMLPGANPAETLTQQELINAQFGLSPDAIMKLNQAKQSKLSEFAQGGAFAATQAGITGIGSSPSV